MTKRLAVVVGILTLLVAAGFGAVAASAAPSDLQAAMNGAKERPGPGDPDGKGEAKVRVDADAGEVCFELKWTKIASPTAGHIHKAGPADPGPIVVDLLGGTSLDTLELKQEFKKCVAGDAEVLAAIAANPRQYYVNLHNARFPAGAIRGQLKSA